MSLTGFFHWFSGGARQYHDLIHCMRGDTLWIAITVALDLAVTTGYCIIAYHWWTNQRQLPPSPAKTALSNLRNIFVFCGICGYLFIPIKMYWPAWRLYDMFMVVLVYYTWRYAWSARDLKVIYTELKRSATLAVELEASREDARKKSFFLNAISHDLRNPLQGVLLQAEVAQMGLEGNDPAVLRASLAAIKAGAKETSDMLNNFLELGRLDWSDEENRSEAFDLSELLAEVSQRFGPVAKAKGIALETVSPRALPIRCDRTKLMRVISNLVDNAIKFTDAGGVRVEAARGNNHHDVAIHVVDTGQGIAPEVAGRVFDEFYQVGNRERNRAKGFGLGLAITRRLVEQLGGAVTLESQPGRGSRFTVAIPGAAAVQPAERAAAQPVPA